MEDKVYEVDSVYPRVAALLRRVYAGEIWLDVLLEKCTSEVPTGIINQFEQVLKDLEPKCGALEINGECLGTVADVQFKIPRDQCDRFVEFIAALRAAAEESNAKERDSRKMPLQCPYQRRRGCLNGDIWIIRHIEHEDHYNTQMTRIKNHRCAAWSDALGRCLRIHPVAFAERHAMRKHNCDDSKIPPQMV